MRRAILTVSAVVTGVALVLAVNAGAKARGQAGLGMSIAVQDDSPIKIVRTESKAGAAFSTVTVLNRSDRRIQAVTFAVLASGNDDKSTDKPAYVEGQLLSASLDPTQTVTLEANLLAKTAVAELFAAFPTGAELQAGVVKVVFSDGSAWSTDAKSRGRFGKGPIVHAARTFGCNSLFARALAAAGFSGYICSTSLSAEECLNEEGGQSCTNSICDPAPAFCQRQRCLLVPDPAPQHPVSTNR